MKRDPKEILKKIRRIELRTRRLVNSSFAGQYHSVFKGRGMNFEEVREYAPGDEIRSIDWNVTARMNAPYVKKFTEEREMTVMLLVDVSASGSFGSVELSKRELAAEVAAILAFSAINNNDKVGLILFSDHVELFIPPKKGRLHTLRLIREMLYFEPRGTGTNISVALDYLNKVVARRAVVFMISDFIAPDYSKPLTAASRRHDLVAMPVVDPGEETLPDIGLVTLEDAESGELIEIDTSSRETRNAYAAAEERRRKDLKKLLGSRGIDQVPLVTNEDYLIPLRSFFEQRERRQAA
ncbi:hypothetical protein TSACC_21873 [Terrimicrobium sacchariphilum]|uniref:VWFA domain-containing protein n=1 Tax=Terrimicrobium sacchariphilum TaxID=690879 RepID=A0A146GA41_TERSA|nr:DUF58 domain-containing protein [Terrimicrobium sacchariphilum]GAT33456.1 hypothetical protein TSACC_21873 [Terrimicrobium sacchariphilum]